MEGAHLLMANVRVQAYCPRCDAIIDATVHATKTLPIIEAFNSAHPPECFLKEETDTNGAKEDGADSGPASAEASGAADDGAAKAPFH